jgi:hypothetical protein
MVADLIQVSIVALSQCALLERGLLTCTPLVQKNGS